MPLRRRKVELARRARAKVVRMRSSPALLGSSLVVFILACPSTDSPDNPFGDSLSTMTTSPGTETGDTSEPTTSTSGDGDGDDPSSCGDGVVEDGEQCDLGPDNAETGQCTPNCMIASCGDGYVYEGFEECDDGNQIDTDDCVAGCYLASCGDGFVHAGVEACDDGNDDEADGCTSTCMTGDCGDGIVQAGEQCDDANMDTSDDCPACQFAFCGDGYIQAGVEICDDGNLDTNDGCISPTCVPAECGDGFVWEGMEECDDANEVDGDMCTLACSMAVCGDGVVYEGVEECDDANDVDDDGCHNDCTADADPQCFEPYNEFDTDTRHETFNDMGITVGCDQIGAGNISEDWAGPGWYRFVGEAGTQMATAPPGDYSCGTHAAGWLDDAHPTPGEGAVMRTVCFDWSPGDCWQTWEIEVVNCVNYYLYNLPDTTSCSYRYCGSDG